MANDFGFIEWFSYEVRLGAKGLRRFLNIRQIVPNRHTLILWFSAFDKLPNQSLLREKEFYRPLQAIFSAGTVS